MTSTDNAPKFLAGFCQALEQVVTSVPHLMFGVKNTHSQIIYYSHSYANFLEINPDKILGKTTVPPLYDNLEIEATIFKEDQQVINNREQLRLLKINKVANRLKPYICVKSPIINPLNQEVVGILLQGLEISVLNLNQLITNCYATIKPPRLEAPKLPHLSKRERQVIFLFMAQLTSQEIAEMIYRLEHKKVSKSTIDSLFTDQLYPKFKVNSRSALYAKLCQLNFDQLIPSDILTSMSIPLATITSF
jgi:hypothetical protein